MSALHSIGCALHFSAPAAVLLALDGGFALPGYLYFAAPHIAWAGVVMAFRLSPTAVHAGFIGSNLALLALHAHFQCCVDNGNGLGWLLYWPLAVLSGIVALGIEMTARLIAGSGDAQGSAGAAEDCRLGSD